jgi:hypothetical protein
MNDGWYKITKVNGSQAVSRIERNRTTTGEEVHVLQNQGCLIEEVAIYTNGELRELIRREVMSSLENM